MKVIEDYLNYVITSQIDEKGLVSHSRDSFNNFVETGINQIITQLFKIEKFIPNKRDKTDEDKEISHIHVEVRFTGCRLSKPSTVVGEKSSRQNALFPNTARLLNLNYSAPLIVDATIRATAYLRSGGEPRVREEHVRDFRIASIPIMVRSNLCNLSDLSYEGRKLAKEDPKDPGCYFIIKSNEWVVNSIESRLFNMPHAFHNVGHKKELSRLEFISKPGDNYENSSEIIIRHVRDGNIYLTFSSIIFKGINIPFYLIFRLYGMSTDKEIIDNIVYGSDNRDFLTEHMLQILGDAFRVSDKDFNELKNITDKVVLLKSFAEKIVTLAQRAKDAEGGKLDQLSINYYTSNLLKSMDKFILPHIGLESDTRHLKMRYMAHLIRRMLLVEMDVIESTDRDALWNKRIHATGHALAKSFKQQVNLAIVQRANRKFTKEFNNMPFSKVPLSQSLRTSIADRDLERALIQSITTGNKELNVNGKHLPNRLASEMLHRKNQLNVLSTLRVIRIPSTSASKQDQRADEIRRVHPSYTGYVCPIQSADTGEQVGKVKQMSLGALILESGCSLILKNKLLEDPDIIPFNKVFPKDIRYMSLVKVNGDIVGCCKVGWKLVQKYKEYRRGYINGKHVSPCIDAFTSIVWDTKASEVQFWLDMGRIVRPLLIIRNNTEFDPIGQEIIGSKYDPIEDTGFVQDILLTLDMVKQLSKKGMTIKKLHELGVVDYVDPGELRNCYIASSLDKLKDNQNNSLKQYTHVEIPASLLGIPALTCPFANYNQAPRVCFQTNQSKQTAGWYSLNYMHRIDKHASLQYYCETALVKTMVNQYLFPNGNNIVLAIGIQEGYNQEDSSVFNRSSVERGLFKVIQYDFTKVDINKDETMGIPDRTITSDINYYADYSHIDKKGLLKEGIIIKENDIILGKYEPLAKAGESGRKYRDTSVVYTSREKALIERVLPVENKEDQKFVKIKYSSLRPVGIGCKFSNRSGNKLMSGMVYDQVDMPFTKNGLIPDIILSPFALPSRMTIGILFESIVAKLAVARGCFYDGTIFKKIDPDSIGDELEKLGFNRHGVERLYNGATGEFLNAMIFIAPAYYQRLQKFSEDELYAVSTSSTCVLTRQPVAGKAAGGGLRIGNMEMDCLIAASSVHFLMEKFREDSDGFDIYVCRTCGTMPVVNEHKKINICKRCESSKISPDIVKVRSTWMSHLLIQELHAMNIGLHLKTAPYKYETQL